MVRKANGSSYVRILADSPIHLVGIGNLVDILER